MRESIAQAKCECGHARKEHYWELTDAPVPKGHCSCTDCDCVKFHDLPDPSQRAA